jgi:hypothetical protein
MWSRLDYIRANYFFEAGNRGLYYCSNVDGNIYRLDESTNYVDNKSSYLLGESEPSSYTENPQQFISKIKTQVTGVAPADNNMTEKVLLQLYLLGGFSSDTVLDIKLFEVGGNVQTIINEPLEQSKFMIQYLPPEAEGQDCSQGCVADTNLNYYKALQIFKRKILFNKPKYTEMYIEITINNAFDFYISDINGIYEISNYDPDYLIFNSKDHASQRPFDTVDYLGNTEHHHCTICNLNPR